MKLLKSMMLSLVLIACTSSNETNVGISNESLMKK